MKTIDRPVAVVGAPAAYARKLFTRGTDFFDAPELKLTYGMDLDPTVVLPFSEAELAQARKLGQVLVRFTSKTKDGASMTMKGIHDQFGNQLSEDDKLMYDTDWYQGEKFFTDETPADGFKLVTRQVIPDSTDEDYLGQTAIIADYVRDEIYEGQELPAEYAQAIEEFEAERERLQKLVNKDWQEGAKQSAELKLNQLFRPTPVELTYCAPLFYRINQEFLLPGKYAWTKVRSSSGCLVRVGYGDSEGVRVGSDDPGSSLSYLGVVVSRSPIAKS